LLVAHRRHLVRTTFVAALVFSNVALDVSAQELIPATSSGWRAFSARPDSMPAVGASSGSPYTLSVDGNGVSNEYGGWRATLSPLSGNQYYRFHARAVVAGLSSPREAVTILLRWHGSYGSRVAPDYVWEYHLRSDGSLVYDRTLQAPAGTTSVDVELVLQWSPPATTTRARFSIAKTPSRRQDVLVNDCVPRQNSIGPFAELSDLQPFTGKLSHLNVPD